MPVPVPAPVPAGRPAPGTPLIFQWRKWDGSPHWRHECVYLGADEWGDWVGQTVGWGSARPGKVLNVTGPSVTLIPSLAGGSWSRRLGIDCAEFAVTVNRGHPKGMRVYIDLGWDIRWGGGSAGGSEPGSAGGSEPGSAGGSEPGSSGGAMPLVTGIDMDLDVVRMEAVVSDPRRGADPQRGGSTAVEDRDEWAEHAARFGYPDDVMARLEALALDLEERVLAEVPPFDAASADVWLDRVEALGIER